MIENNNKKLALKQTGPDEKHAKTHAEKNKAKPTVRNVHINKRARTVRVHNTAQHSYLITLDLITVHMLSRGIG